ncbi:MAG: cation transporter [Actinobacteria bacterium]|nr:cation transporter [Actinomycetota bacterium]
MHKKIVYIKGMHCRSCSLLIEEALRKIKGIIKVKVNYKNGYAEAGAKVYQKAFKKGVAWILAKHNLRMSPPLIMEENVAAKALGIIDEAITEVEKEYGY